MNENENQQQQRHYTPWYALQLARDFEELAKMSETDIKRYSGERGA